MIDLFNSLPEEKKKTILNACIEEFCEYGYEGSSTNRIVQKAQISKGSLFKYFETKDRLYLYSLNYIGEIILDKMSLSKVTLSTDLIDRILQYAEMELDIYLEYPNYLKLLKQVMMNPNIVIHEKWLKKYRVHGEQLYWNLLNDIDLERLQFDKIETLQLIKWVLKGFNEEFLHEAKAIEDSHVIKKTYLKRLNLYLQKLTMGIYKEKS